jgi:tetratricopeptide (TPR) repeat protein
MTCARVSVATALLWACCAFEPVARADAVSERARTIFQQGQQSFERRDYAAAAAAFEEAAQLAPHPAAWLDAGQSWELDGNLARAAEDCDRALALSEVPEDLRREAERRLERIVPKIGTLDVKSATTLVLKIDGTGDVTVPGKHRVSPGNHRIAVIDLAGAPMRTIDVTVAPGETATLSLSPPPARRTDEAREATPQQQTPAAQLPPAHRHGPPLAAWVAFGSSAAAAAAAVIAGEATLSARSDFNATPSFATRDRFYEERTLTNVFWAVAGAAAATGVGFWVLQPSERRRTAIGLVIQGGALALTHETRF